MRFLLFNIVVVAALGYLAVIGGPDVSSSESAKLVTAPVSPVRAQGSVEAAPPLVTEGAAKEVREPVKEAVREPEPEPVKEAVKEPEPVVAAVAAPTVLEPKVKSEKTVVAAPAPVATTVVTPTPAATPEDLMAAEEVEVEPAHPESSDQPAAPRPTPARTKLATLEELQEAWVPSHSTHVVPGQKIRPDMIRPATASASKVTAPVKPVKPAVAIAEGESLMSAKQRKRELGALAQEMEMMFITRAGE